MATMMERMDQLERQVSSLTNKLDNFLFARELDNLPGRAKEQQDEWEARHGLSGLEQPGGVAGRRDEAQGAEPPTEAGSCAGRGEGEEGRVPPEGFWPCPPQRDADAEGPGEDAGPGGQAPARDEGAERGAAADCQGENGRPAGDHRGQGAEADQAGAQPAAVRSGDGELDPPPRGAPGFVQDLSRRLDTLEELLRLIAVEGHDKKLWDYPLLLLRAGMKDDTATIQAPELVLDREHAERALMAMGNPRPTLMHQDNLLELMREHRGHGGGGSFLAAVDALEGRQGPRIVRERLGIIDELPNIEGLPGGNARLEALKVMAETGCDATQAGAAAGLARAQMGHSFPGGRTLDRLRIAAAKDGEAVRLPPPGRPPSPPRPGPRPVG